MKDLKFLLFDSNAISAYISSSSLQSIEYAQGQRFVDHVRAKHESELFENTLIEYYDNGIIFLGKVPQSQAEVGEGTGYRIFCIDILFVMIHYLQNQ